MPFGGTQGARVTATGNFSVTMAPTISTPSKLGIQTKRFQTSGARAEKRKNVPEVIIWRSLVRVLGFAWACKVCAMGVSSVIVGVTPLIALLES